MTENPLHAVISTKQVAELYGLTVRRVQQIVSAGYIKKAGRGKYVLADVVRGMRAHDVDDKEGKSAGSEYQSERTRNQKLQAEQREFDLAVARKEYAPIDVIQNTLSQVAESMAASFDSLCARLGQRYPKINERDRKRLIHDINDARRELADITPRF